MTKDNNKEYIDNNNRNLDYCKNNDNKNNIKSVTGTSDDIKSSESGASDVKHCGSLDKSKDNKKNKLNKSKEKQLERDIELMKKDEEKNKNKISNKKYKENNSSDKSGGSNSPKKPSKRSIIIAVVIVICAVLLFSGQFANDATSMFTDEISTSDFITALDQNRVKNVVYDSGAYNVSGTYYPQESFGARTTNSFNSCFNSITDSVKNDSNANDLTFLTTQSVQADTHGTLKNYKATFIGQDSLLELMQKHTEVQYEITLPSGWTDTLVSLLPIALVALLIFFFFSQMSKMNSQQFGFGKTKAKKENEERPDVKFSDVAGVDEAVEEMSEVKDFLAHPEKYQEMGAKIPRGCLLVGPPGTGKTLLARAVAGEAGVPFFNISGSDFVEMFVGVGASRVRDLFKQAKEASPSIIFIDEIDAVGRHRGAGLGGGHDEREQTLNQMLVEMDGFDQNDSVVLIAATNRVDILDPALLRPGRFDRQIIVDVPDAKGREQILQVHSKNKKLKGVDLHRTAQLTSGFTGADLANLMNESALLAARKNQKVITQKEVSESMERVIAGPERKSRMLDPETKKTIAYHESGHALIGHILPKAAPVHKISIISRGRALGYTISIPKEDRVLVSYKEMLSELAVFMGGRVAEEIFCDDITTGASNDLERATKIARNIVTQYGMSKKLGTQVFGQPNHEVFLGKDYGNTQDYSEATAQKIDAEVAKLMRKAHDAAEDMLLNNKDQIHLMAQVLIERETVEGEACEALLNNKWQAYLEKEKNEMEQENLDINSDDNTDNSDGKSNEYSSNDSSNKDKSKAVVKGKHESDKDSFVSKDCADQNIKESIDD